MADVPTYSDPAASAARPGAPKKALASRLAGAVASHAYASLALIIVLVILVVGLYTYYHGILFLGPYAKGGKGKKKDKASDEGEVSGDPETERLIDSINRH
jgi:hypothetical protein